MRLCRLRAQGGPDLKVPPSPPVGGRMVGGGSALPPAPSHPFHTHHQLVILTKMPTPLPRFTQITAFLREAIARAAARNRVHAPVLVLAWARIGRMLARFQRLFDRWRDGTLPSPRPSRPNQPRRPGPAPRLPGGLWFPALVPEFSTAAVRLEAFLADPTMVDFLAACPQAGRILRPLCRLLALPLTPSLRPPARSGRLSEVRPASPPPPPPVPGPVFLPA
jgi:hypothetical protein